MDHKIPDNRLHINRIGKIFTGTELFQRLNQPGLIAFGNIRFGIVENIGIAAAVFVDIFQQNILTAASESPDCPPAAEAALLPVPALHPGNPAPRKEQKNPPY